MSRSCPELPETLPERFRATVHGIAFAERAQQVAGLRPGDALRLIADPPGAEVPAVWVHAPSGAPLGHLPPEIALWLWPYLAQGGQAHAAVLRAHGDEVPSWRRLVVDVTLQA